MRNRIRLSDIAAKANVSVSTVSRALANHPLILPETRQRIVEIAGRLGYVPNAFASSLARLRQPSGKAAKANLAFVCGHEKVNPVEHWKCWNALYRAAAEESGRLGYSLEAFWRYAPGMTARGLGRILKARGVQGLFLLMIGTHELEVEWENLAVCARSSLHHERHWHHLDRDLYRDTVALLTYLLEMGYRRIGLSIPQDYDQWNFDGGVGAGFWAISNLLPPALRLPMFRTRSLHYTFNRFETWVAKARPEVVVSTSHAVLQWISQLGYKVPQEMGYVNIAVDDMPPGITALDPRMDLQGIAAANLLISQIQRNERGHPSHPQAVIVPAAVREGRTTKRISKPEPILGDCPWRASDPPKIFPYVPSA